MNIFSPGCPGISRGTPISYNDWQYSVGDFTFTTVKLEDTDLFPSTYQVSDFPIQAPAFYRVIDGIDPPSLPRCIPGAMCRDAPYINAVRRYINKIDQPSPSSEVTTVGPSIEFYGKHYSNDTLFWGKGSNSGLYDAPYYRFNTLIYKLPEYFILDASAGGLTSQLVDIEGETVFFGISEASNTKLLMRRDDRLGSMAQRPFVNNYGFRTLTSTPELSVLEGTPSAFTPLGFYPLAASYVPVYDIINKRVPFWHDPNFPTDDPEAVNDWASLKLCCRCWRMLIQSDSEVDEFYSPLEWHIQYISPHQENEITGLTDPQIFTPLSGFYWEGNRKWFLEEVGNTDIGPRGPHGYRGIEFLFTANEVESNDPPHLYNNDQFRHHGHLDPYGTTDFILGGLGDIYTLPGFPYSSEAAIRSAPRIKVTPCYL